MPSNNRSSTRNRNDDLDAIREDFSNLRDDFSSLVSDLASGGRNVAQRSGDTIADKAKDTMEQVRSLHASTGETVSKYPVTSMLVAAGVGAIAARLLMRSRG